MRINKIDHVCVAVKDLAEARRTWERILGKVPDEEYEDQREQIRVARYRFGEVGFELMESTTPDGPVARHIAKRGEGLMVLAFNVDGTGRAVEELEDKGVAFIPAPDTGRVLRPFRAGHFAFADPRALNRVLLELIDDGEPTVTE